MNQAENVKCKLIEDRKIRADVSINCRTAECRERYHRLKVQRRHSVDIKLSNRRECCYRGENLYTYKDDCLASETHRVCARRDRSSRADQLRERVRFIIVGKERVRRQRSCALGVAAQKSSDLRFLSHVGKFSFNSISIPQAGRISAAFIAATPMVTYRF